MTKCPELLSEWDYAKNDLKPEEVAYSSVKKIWWICNKGHNWEASPLSRIKHGLSKCPYCSNQKVLSGYNDFATLYPNLLKEWDYSKNEEHNPYNIIAGSHIKVWWICKHGHSYKTSIGNRIKGTNCPYCAGQKVLVGFNDLASNYPELINEWDYNKNKFNPNEVSSGSGLAVWWKCKKGHSWKSIISNRTKNGKRGCPICANRVLLTGYNDLATTNPNLLEEWDYEKNTNISPTKIIAGSTKKVWWKCKIGHSWKASIVSRNKNHFCPICNLNKQTSISEKAIVYYLLKAGIKLIENYKIEKKELDIFIPKYKIGIEYDGQYYHSNMNKDIVKNKLCEKKGITLIRVREPELPLLNSTSIDIRISELVHNHSYMNEPIKKLLNYLQIYNIDVDVERDLNLIYELFQKGIISSPISKEFPKLLEEWNYEKNGTLSPDKVSKGVHLRVWWKCQKCNYDWQATVYSRTNGSGCPKCANRINAKKPSKLKLGENDFKTLYPNMLKEWDYEKNEIEPQSLTVGSNKKVWWKCFQNHSYQASIYNRLKGTGCPYCANKKVLIGYNDLQTTHPQLANEWNYPKNDKTPSQYTAGSGKKVWWKCKNGHEWEAIVYSRANGVNCPICSGRKSLKGYNDLTTIYPEILELWDYSKNINISPTELSCGSHKKVWWKCKNGHEYERFVYNQVSRNGKCPICKE